jgi:hypothetical protein
MLARIITSYIEKNTNSKIGVQGAMLIGTNETKIVWRLSMTLTKWAKNARMKEEECHS